MAFSSYSLTPSLVTTIGGVSVAEGCAAGNLNDVCRQLASDGRALSDTVTALDVSGKMPKSGGAFTGAITRSSAGGYLYHASSAQSGGKVSILASGATLPSSPAEGDMVFFY